jgi:hypothetical protein
MKEAVRLARSDDRAKVATATVMATSYGGIKGTCVLAAMMRITEVG